VDGHEKMTVRNPRIPIEAKNLLFDIYWCCYCGRNGMNHEDPDGDPWTYDHLFPLGFGGSDSLSNIVKSCWSCNEQKWGNLWEPIPKTLKANGEYVKNWATNAMTFIESLSQAKRKPEIYTDDMLNKRFRSRSIPRDVFFDLVKIHEPEEMYMDN